MTVVREKAPAGMRREIFRCFWNWPFGHKWVPGYGRDSHPAMVCRDCPKAASTFGVDWEDASPKRGVASPEAVSAGHWIGWIVEQSGEDAQTVERHG